LQVGADGCATTHRPGLRHAKLCWRNGGKVVAAESREGDDGDGEEESRREGAAGEGMEESEDRVWARVRWGIRSGLGWWKGAFEKHPGVSL
jgi:hypothetical protein